MSYVPKGPFTNGSFTPPIDATFLNDIESALRGAAASNTAPAATGIAATDTANLQAAIAAAQTARVDLYVPGGAQRYVLTTGLTWDLSRGSLLGIGQCDLDFTALTAGYALEIIGSPAATAGDIAPTGGGNYYSQRPITNRVAGFRIQGPMGIESNNADGVVVRASLSGSVEPAQGSVERLFIRGFRDGLVHGLGSFLIKNEKIFVGSQWRRGISLATGTLLGENISFIGCTTSGVKNSTGTGVAVYTDAAAIADAMFYGCSFDYSDIEFDHNSGDITIVGCHLENGSAGPMVQLASTGNGTTFTALGGSWRSSGTGAPRDHMVEVKAGSTSDVTFTVAGGGGGPATLATQFFVNKATTTIPAVSITNFVWIGGRHTGANYTTFGEYLNLLTNGDFETSTSFNTGIAGWSAGSLSGVTHAINSSHAKTGTNCLNVTATGAAGTDITRQMVAIAPGRSIAVSADVAIWNVTAGAFQVMVVFYGADRSTTLSTFRVTDSISTTQNPYQTSIARMVPPKGAAFAEVQVQAVNFNGYATVDNVQVTQL